MVLYRCSQHVQIGLRVLQQLVVLFKAQTSGLRFELQVDDALAQGFQQMLGLESLFIAGTQAVGQVIVFIALGRQQGFPLNLQCQGILQTCTRCGVAEQVEFFLLFAMLSIQVAYLLRRCVLGALQLLLPRLQTAHLKLSFLALLVGLQQCFAQGLKGFFLCQLSVLQLGVALLGLPQLHIQFFKASLGGLLLLL